MVAKRKYEETLIENDDLFLKDFLERVRHIKNCTLDIKQLNLKIISALISNSCPKESYKDITCTIVLMNVYPRKIYIPTSDKYIDLINDLKIIEEGLKEDFINYKFEESYCTNLNIKLENISDFLDQNFDIEKLKLI